MTPNVMSPSLERMLAGVDAEVTLDAPLAKHTWFGVGGSCDALVKPRSIIALERVVTACHLEHIPVRVLGSGANLLVSDGGVDGVVLKLDLPCFAGWNFCEDGSKRWVVAGGGANMTTLMNAAVRVGLDGLCPMAGIPASVGGALRMNAGGRYGAIGDVVESVTVMDVTGGTVHVSRAAMHFDYRHSNLPTGLFLECHLRLTPDDPQRLRERVLEIMEYKKTTQPLPENSAGCMFRNPLLPTGERISAGMLIDQAGLKGVTEGSAKVSTQHANFLCVQTGGRANDLFRLAQRVQQQVKDTHGVSLHMEVVHWQRGDRTGALQ